jgi:subtilisin family serine protease
MIIDFDFEPHKDTEFEPRPSAEDEKKWEQHQGKVINLLKHYEKKYGFERTGMTSWVKTSATAFLTPKLVDLLSKDKRVNLLTENSVDEFSAAPPWNNFLVGNEHRSWGYQATNGKSGYAPASGRRVYIIDSGVAWHDDLPGVSNRVNMACGNNLTNCSTGGTTDIYPVVGCYPHSTHVAGIIGAKGGNGKTGAGIYDAANMISVAVISAGQDVLGKCNSNKLVLSAVGYGLDYVYRQILGSTAGQQQTKAPIINFSINSGRLGFSSTGVAETNRVALLKVATPATVYLFNPSTLGYTAVNYVGAFVAQSAGNITTATGTSGQNVCTEFRSGGESHAYTHAFPNNSTTNPNDGIMVVGAIHNDGPAADQIGINSSRRFDGQYDSNGIALGQDHSSNYGPCIDVWAPGNLIYSTWGMHDPNSLRSIVGVTYSGSGVSNTVTQGWNFLSGTSMAAPHVAGAAAYLADLFNLTTPAQIEQKVRQYLVSTGYNDRSGIPIKIVQLP